MAKYNFDIEIANSAKICGGYLTTIANVTRKQIAKQMERFGRELIGNNRGIDTVSYFAWNTDENSEDSPVYVSLSKHGRKINVYVDLAE